MENSTDDTIVKDHETLWNAIKKEFPTDTLAGISPDGSRTVQVPTRPRGRIGLCEILWQVQPGIVNFIQFFPIKITEQNLEPLTKKIVEINRTLAVLGFVIDDRSVTFITHAFLDKDGTIKSHVIMKNIRQCHLMFDLFLDEFEKIAEKEKDTKTSEKKKGTKEFVRFAYDKEKDDLQYSIEEE